MANSDRKSVRLRLIAPRCWPRGVEAHHREAAPVDRAVCPEGQGDPEGRVDRAVRSDSGQADPAELAAQVVLVAPEDRASGPTGDRRAA